MQRQCPAAGSCQINLLECTARETEPRLCWWTICEKGAPNKNCMVSVWSQIRIAVLLGLGHVPNNKCILSDATKLIESGFVCLFSSEACSFCKSDFIQETDENFILCSWHLVLWLMLQNEPRVIITPNDCTEWEGGTGTKCWKFVRWGEEDHSSKMMKLL